MHSKCTCQGVEERTAIKSVLLIMSMVLGRKKMIEWVVSFVTVK